MVGNFQSKKSWTQERSRWSEKVVVVFVGCYLSSLMPLVSLQHRVHPCSVFSPHPRSHRGCCAPHDRGSTLKRVYLL
ncbi:hypothetical protein HanRHA438_Chr12g0538111 [Helianthus annuus]|nr:hypothetical protein HanRHA438_Chr12g0538111 [Helianthus annuus]